MLARMAPTSTASPMAHSAVTANAARLRDREQRWRGKYLRALNVCPPNPPNPQNPNNLQRRKSLSALSMRARLQAQRSWREDPSNRSSQSRPEDLGMLRTSRVSFASTTQARVFDQDLTRTSRSRSDWSGFRPEEELGSAPIEIPTTEAFDFEREPRRTAKRVGSERSCLDRRRANSSHAHSHSSSRGSLGWGSTNPSGTTECSELDGYVEDEWDDDEEDEELEELGLELEMETEMETDRSQDDSGERERESDIFAMEEDLELDPESESDDGSLPLAMRGRRLDPEFSRGSRSKSLRRAASENVLPIGRSRPMAMPRPLDGLQEHATTESDMLHLPESFVPPHEMVQRDCFSLGMRDQLKRRPDHVI